jgi:hypothetical protein
MAGNASALDNLGRAVGRFANRPCDAMYLTGVATGLSEESCCIFKAIQALMSKMPK